MLQPIPIKLFVLECSNVGKTSLLITYIQNQFPTYELGELEIFGYNMKVKIKDTMVDLSLWDREKPTESGPIRRPIYPNVDVFPYSFLHNRYQLFHRSSQEGKSLPKQWYPELRQTITKNVPIIFVGTKSDLRAQFQMKDNNPQDRPVPKHHALKVIEEQLGCKYIECSALTQHCLKDVFDEVIKAALVTKLKKIKRKSYQLI